MSICNFSFVLIVFMETMFTFLNILSVVLSCLKYKRLSDLITSATASEAKGRHTSCNFDFVHWFPHLSVCQSHVSVAKDML